MTRREVALVAAGGAIGATLRWCWLEAAPVVAGTFPRTTFLVNVLGAFLLGIVVGNGARVWWARPLLGVGLLGGFTTMSTFATETATLARTGHGATAAIYVTSTVVIGIAAAGAGLYLAGWRPGRTAVPATGEE